MSEYLLPDHEGEALQPVDWNGLLVDHLSQDRQWLEQDVDNMVHAIDVNPLLSAQGVLSVLSLQEEAESHIEPHVRTFLTRVIFRALEDGAIDDQTAITLDTIAKLENERI